MLARMRGALDRAYCDIPRRQSSYVHTDWMTCPWTERPANLPSFLTTGLNSVLPFFILTTATQTLCPSFPFVSYSHGVYFSTKAGLLYIFCACSRIAAFISSLHITTLHLFRLILQLVYLSHTISAYHSVSFTKIVPKRMFASYYGGALLHWFFTLTTLLFVLFLPSSMALAMPSTAAHLPCPFCSRKKAYC